MKTKECLKEVKKIFEQLKNGWIFVEGKKDKQALNNLGFEKILTIAGNLRLSCEKLAKEKGEIKVFVLTDIDRRGDQLAGMAKEELEGISLRVDLTMRKKLAYALNIRYFENAKRAYDKLIKEGENNG